MTTETPETFETAEAVAGREPAGAVSDEQLIAMLVDRARGDGLKLTGEGGLLQQLTKRVLESALDGEITDHVGYDKRPGGTVRRSRRRPGAGASAAGCGGHV